MTARFLRRGRLIDLLLWATTAGLALLTLLFSFGLSAPGAGTFAFADKIGHGLMYFATFLCLLLAAVWRPGRGDGPFPTMALPFAIGVVIAGIAIEGLQEAVTGGRHAEVGDVLAEAAGAFGALAIHAWMRQAWSFASRSPKQAQEPGSFPSADTRTGQPEAGEYHPFVAAVERHDTHRTVLEPPGRWSALKLGELWHYRELLYILAWRDVKVRYKQALLGAAWAVVQPLIMMGIFTLLFSRIANVPTGGIPYPVFAFAALVPWTMFANATAGSGGSLVSNQNLVSKVYFPRLVIPTGSVLAWVPDFLIGSALLFLIMAIFGFAPPITASLLPLVMIATVIASLSVGVWLSALNVAYRDVQYVVPFLVQAWLFITPVAYPTTSVPEGLRWVTGLNPMLWVVDLARWALLGTDASWGLVLLSVLTTAALLVSGLYYFRRVEHFFADVI